MKKLYVCEYPYILYKTLIERMGDDQNSYSLILTDGIANLGPMVRPLRQSRLFDQIDFFPCAPYRDFYHLYFFDLPQSKARKNFIRLKNQLIISKRQKEFRGINFPFDINFKQYDKIICSDFPWTTGVRPSLRLSLCLRF